MKKRILTALIGLIICVIIVCFELFNNPWNAWSIGSNINKFFPCQQNPMNSFPCQGVYDLYFMAVVAIIGVVFLGILIYTGCRYIRSK